MRLIRSAVPVACLCLGAALLATAADTQEKVDPKLRTRIEELEKALPEYEAAADRFEQQLQPIDRKSVV